MWLIFTDGACNPESSWGGVGGVLISPDGSLLEYFGASVPEDLMKALMSASQNPIFELELAPLFLSLHFWGERMRGGQFVCYLDNDGARRSMIRSYSEIPFALRVIEAFLELESLYQLKVWFGRVPTSSDVADGPSRLDFAEVHQRGASRRLCTS